MEVKAIGARNGRLERMTKFDFDARPFIVIWEVTRACSLACSHCRAEANLSRHPLELNTEEAFRFIEQVERCRPTLFVMTGGDPIRRLNLESLIRHATNRGLRVSLSPSATPEFAAANLDEFKDAGVERISLSLDGARRETHDQFRGAPATTAERRPIVVWNITASATSSASTAARTPTPASIQASCRWSSAAVWSMIWRNSVCLESCSRVASHLSIPTSLTWPATLAPRACA